MKKKNISNFSSQYLYVSYKVYCKALGLKHDLKSYVNYSLNKGPLCPTYIWLRNGKIIAGATNSTYTLTKRDNGEKISCKVQWVSKNK